MNELGYALGSEELGPGLRHAAAWHPHRHRAWRGMGLDEVLRRFGTMTFKETLQPAIDYAEQGFPVSDGSRTSGGCRRRSDR